MRFSVLSLLVVIVYIAVGCTALVKATEGWASAVATLTAATLLAAAVTGATSQGGRRAFGCGFALGGLGYLAFVYAPGAAENIAPHLATTKTIEWAEVKIHGEGANLSSFAFSPDGKWVAGTPGGKTMRIWDLTSVPLRGAMPKEMFILGTGQCVWALVIGCLGGLLGQYCYTTSVRMDRQQSSRTT
jgi:hypothetical protein